VNYLAPKRIKAPHPRCQVCRHEERWRIELLRAGGASLDALAAKFKVDRDAIWRHMKNHVSDEVKASYLAGPVQLAELAAKASDTGGSILDHLIAVRTVLWGHLDAATQAADGKLAALISDKLVKTLEVAARISGELGDLAKSTVYNTTINNVAVLTENPAFMRVQATLLRALGPFPEARAAVVAALRDLEAGNAPAISAAPANGKLIEMDAVHVDW
jgi:hypothetical protein